MAAVVGGVVADRAMVHATTVDTEVTGALRQDTEGPVVIDDGVTAYTVVGGMDFTPFLGQTVVLDGGLDQQTLYVRALTLGAIHLQDQQDGTFTMDTAGTVEQIRDGFQMTVEGIEFTLDGDGLDQVVGQTVQVDGELIGNYLTVTAMHPL